MDLFFINILTFNIIFDQVKSCSSIMWSLPSRIHLKLIQLGYIDFTTRKTHENQLWTSHVAYQ